MHLLPYAVLLAAAFPLSAQNAEVLQHFDYDQKAPLDKQIVDMRRGADLLLARPDVDANSKISTGGIPKIKLNAGTFASSNTRA